jgi:circadian clock protein KaiC
MGPAGCGKSSLAVQFVARAAKRDELVAAFLFDEGISIYLARSAGLGTDIRADVETGRIKVQQIDPAELSPGEFAHYVRRVVEQEGARVVVIDSINGYMQAMPDERFLTAQMHELLSYLNQQGVVTLLVMAQHGFLSTQMGTPVDVSYLADSVILLRYFEAQGAVRRAISVIKKRTGFHEDTIRELRLSTKGIEVGKPLKEFHGVLTGIPTYSGKSESLSGDGDEKG